jgi:hypothetical protein
MGIQRVVSVGMRRMEPEEGLTIYSLLGRYVSPIAIAYKIGDRMASVTIRE